MPFFFQCGACKAVFEVETVDILECPECHVKGGTFSDVTDYSTDPPSIDKKLVSS